MELDKGMMEIDEIIRGRRSVRRYRPDPVPRKLIEEVLELAQWAPSAINRQQWHFVVVEGPARERLAEICGRSVEPLVPHIEQAFPNRPDVVGNLRSFFRTLGGAPVVIVAFCTASNPEDSDIQSVAAAVQTLLLAAHSKGLGTCWMTGPRFKEPEVNALCGMEGSKLIAVIPMGYPDERPKPAPRQPDRITYVGT
jgi:nitroreductase